MKSYVLCGMQYGDEGKGSFVDYLAHKVKPEGIIKYNGGSQASHTVICPSGTKHRFAQLGSGMFYGGCDTYITENMIINPDNLLREIEAFSRETGESVENILSRVHIHEKCYVVTEYHKLLNRMRELASGDERRGSVGTGVSEVARMVKESDWLNTYAFTIGDIYYSLPKVVSTLSSLMNYCRDFYNNNREKIWNNCEEEETKENLEIMIGRLIETNSFLNIAFEQYKKGLIEVPYNNSLEKCLYNSHDSLRKCETAIWEGSQGFLIDKEYGIKPNTTLLDTTNKFALDIAYKNDKVVKIGIARAFTTRHGPGVFPTEDSKLSDKISDKNQDHTVWNGKPRYGWFDAVMLRYAQRVNQVDKLYLSSLDLLNGEENVYICNEYEYNGDIDDEFMQLFEYYTDSVGTHITNIIKNSDNLKKYLQNCSPVYISVKGWNDAKNISEIYHFIHLIELLTYVTITVVSVGPTRNDKFELTDILKNEV